MVLFLLQFSLYISHSLYRIWLSCNLYIHVYLSLQTLLFNQLLHCFTTTTFDWYWWLTIMIAVVRRERHDPHLCTRFTFLSRLSLYPFRFVRRKSTHAHTTIVKVTVDLCTFLHSFVKNFGDCGKKRYSKIVVGQSKSFSKGVDKNRGKRRVWNVSVTKLCTERF